MLTLAISPFVYDGPVSREQMIDREAELEALVAAAGAGRLTCVYGPRRYGKTSLLDAAVEVADQAHGMVALRVDLLGVLSLTDLTVRIELAYRNTLTGPVRRAVQALFASANVGLSLSGGGFGLQVARQPRTDPVPALHALLELPTRIDPRAYIVLDEFQSLMAVDGAEAILRSHVQQHREHASYAFAGSEPGLMEQAFSDRRRPLYAQATPLRLPRLPGAAVLDRLHADFEATGRELGDMGESLLGLTNGHPQRTMLLTDLLWQRTPQGGTATPERLTAAVDDALARTRNESETRWAALTANQKRVLRGVVEYRSAMSRDALAALGMRKGSVQATQDALVADGDLERLEGGGYQLVDPFFAEWIRRTVGR